MRNLLKISMLAMMFGFIFIGVDTVNAQSRERQARREYQKDIREANRDYRNRINNGDYSKAQRKYQDDLHDARRDYNRATNRDYNRNNRNYNNRYYRNSNSRYYYYNGRLYRRW